MSSMVIEMGAVKASFARRLKASRNAIGWTQQQASNELGVVVRTYQLWENPRVPQLPEGENAVRVFYLMGVTLVDEPYSGDSATARYLSRPRRPMTDDTQELVLTG